jgi:uncharacterized membrane protein YeaQ/YmgE (transglycosylase-associated protein family)
MGIVTWAVWGLFVGVIARVLKPGRRRMGLGLTVVLGIVGSLVGGFVATQWLDIADADDFDFGSFLIAVVASVALLAVYERVDRMLPGGESDPGTQLER